MRRHVIIGPAVFVLLAVCMLSVACGAGDKPAITPGTLLPSAGGTPASPGASPGTASASPSQTTLTPGATPTATGGNGGQITDASIKANILRRIAETAALTGLRLTISVNEKTVYLKGNVKTQAQKASVEQIAVTEPGIAKVVSYLVVQPKGDGGY